MSERPHHIHTASPNKIIGDCHSFFSSSADFQSAINAIGFQPISGLLEAAIDLI